MRLAIIVDHLIQNGGAERVIAAIHEIWPEAPIYTSVHDPNLTHPELRDADVRTSILQRFAANSKLFRMAMPLYPFAFEQFDLSEFDVVLSTSSSFAHGVVTQPETVHICYCHTPARFLWRYHDFANGGSMGKLSRGLLSLVNHRLRIWDFCAAQRVDTYVANSANVAERIKKFYRRDSIILHPPVASSLFRMVEKPTSDYFLIVSRMVGYKRMDLAVEACTRLNMPLKVVGSGPELKRLKSIAGPSVSFLGRVTDEDLAPILANCRGFIFPGEEDFGIAPLEAMVSGRPVIAYAAGGALETVVSGVTGTFFREQTTDSLCEALRGFDPDVYESAAIRAHALQWDTRQFQNRLMAIVEGARRISAESSIPAHFGLRSPVEMAETGEPVTHFALPPGQAPKQELDPQTLTIGEPR